MGHSRAEKAQHHDRILALASRQIRQGGLDGINVVELMRAAGLTHGGFYRHFASRADLVAQALRRAFVDGAARALSAHPAAATISLKRFVRGYLSRAHRDEPGDGCAIAALAADIGRADAEARALLARHLEASAATVVGGLGESDPADARKRALAIMSTLVGALILARAVKAPGLSDEILQSAGEFVLTRGPS
jgi:TetR/AcrR family transcriptional regulator, transcriptional repressor for nem operon